MGEIINIKSEQVYPKWLNVELWKEYVEHRKEIKSPMTERAERMGIRKLGRLVDDGDSQEDILETAIFNNWKGLWKLEK